MDSPHAGVGLVSGLLFPSSRIYRRFGPLWRWEADALDIEGETVATGSGWALSFEGAEVGRDVWLTNVGCATFT